MPASLALCRMFLCALLTVQLAAGAVAEPAPSGGLVFPDRLGALRRGERTDYEAQAPGLGFSVRYNSAGTKADLFVYDKGAELNDGDVAKAEEERDAALVDIAKMVEAGHYRHADIEERATRPIGHTAFATARATIDDQRARLDSFVYVAILRGRFLKIRYSTGAAAASAKRADAFLAAFLKAQP